MIRHWRPSFPSSFLRSVKLLERVTSLPLLRHRVNDRGQETNHEIGRRFYYLVREARNEPLSLEKAVALSPLELFLVVLTSEPAIECSHCHNPAYSAFTSMYSRYSVHRLVGTHTSWENDLNPHERLTERSTISHI